MQTMSTYRPPASKAQERHHRAAVHYAERHFTDPDLQAEDAAIFFNISGRTLRESLRACDTSWREIIRNLRLERAEELLRTTKHEVAVVARLSGYRSAPALAAVFLEHYKMSPARWRRGFGGPARAGGPTGAFYKSARRVRALKVADASTTNRDGMPVGDYAIQQCENEEACERIGDRQILMYRRPESISTEELTYEVQSPQHLREDPAFWRKRRDEWDAWVEEYEPGGGATHERSERSSTTP